MFESGSGFMVQLRGCGGRVGAAVVVAGLLVVGLVLVPGAATGQTPAQPTGLTATHTSNSVVVSWTPAVTQTAGCAHKRYEVEVKVEFFDDPIGGVKSVTPPGPYTVTVTGLTPGTNYDVKLDVVGTCGAWANSVYVTFTTTGTAPSTTTTTTATTQDQSLPANPTGFSIDPSGTQAVISWTPGTATNCAHKRYEVEIRAEGSDTIIGGVKTVTPPGPYTVTVTGLTAGNRYTAKLDVIGVCGRWAPSQQGSFVVGMPLKPTELSARAESTAEGNVRVVLSWENPANYSITGYELRQRTGTGDWGAWTAISTAPAVPNSLINVRQVHTVSGLDVGPTYGFEVRAVNPAGKSPESDTVEAGILPARTHLPGGVPETWMVKFRSAALVVPGVYRVGWSTVGNCDPSERSATSLGAVTTDPGVGSRLVVVDVPEGAPDSATVSSPGVRASGFEVDVSAATRCVYEFSVSYESNLSGDAGKGCTVRVTGVGKSGDESGFRVSYSARTAGSVYNLVVDTSDCAEMATIRVTLGPAPSAGGPASFRDPDGTYLDSDPTVGAILAKAFKVTATPTDDSDAGCRAASAHTRVDPNGTFTRNDDEAFALLRVVKEAGPSGSACHYNITTVLPAGFVTASAGSNQSRVESYELSPATKLVADGSDSGTAPDVVSTTAADCGESVTTGLGADNRLGSSDDTKATVSGSLCLTHSVKVAARELYVTQNVTGDPAGGTARYTLTESKACSSQAAPMISTVNLHEGNFNFATRHALNYNASPCLVTVAVSHLPAGCATTTPPQTLNLATADPDQANASFNITCPTTSSTDTGDMAEDMLIGPPEDIPTS